ncbi:hypothetical protein GCM10023146_38870 [Nocardioides caricicola]
MLEAGAAHEDLRGAPALASGIAADLRVMVVGLVLAVAVSSPTWALRTGAVVCACVLVTSLGHLRLRRPDLLVVAFAGLALASTVWTVAPAQTSLGATNTAACAIVFLTVRAVVRRPRDLRVLSISIVGGCLYGLAQLWFQNPLLRAVRLRYDVEAARVGVEGLNYNALAYAFATGAAVLVLLWAAVGPSRRKVAALTGAAVAIAFYVGILLNGTRGAVIAIVLLPIWLVVSHFRPRVAFHGLVGLAVVANIVVFLGIADGALRNDAVASARETGDLNGRLLVWPVARDAIWEQPLLGRGVDSLMTMSVNPVKTAAHNAWLDTAVGLGLVGLALFIAGIWFSLAEAADWPTDRRYVVVGAFVVVSVPIMLTGYWTESPLFWGSLALFSRLGVLDRPPSA